MYGHHDGPGVSDHFRQFIPPFTVIEGTSTDATFISELRAQARVYAAHVNNLQTSTTAELVAAWRAPFDNTLGGQLPGGYDAIAIDELHATATDGTAESGRVIAALQQLRSLYPDKLVFVAAVWQYAQNSQDYVNLLNAVNDYADMLMLEKYMREGNLSYWSVTYADRLKAAVPGILSKSVFGLYISQAGHIADDRSDVGFWGILDEQFHRIRNDSDAATMPGLMFWAYYRTALGVTPDYCARLCDHYYIQGNTGYLGDGLTTQMISNPGFDANTSGWTLTPGAGGTAVRFAYSSEGVRDTHSADPILNLGQGPVYVSHGTHGLKMVRGSTHNTAAYSIAVDTSLTYTVSAWVLANVDNTRAKVTITESNGAHIESEEIVHAGTYDYARIAFNFAPPSSPVKIVLNDETTVPGKTLYWDFIEMEDAFPTAAVPPPQCDVSWGASTGLFFPGPAQGVLPQVGDELLARLYLAPDGVIDSTILPGGVPSGDDIVLDSAVLRNNGNPSEDFAVFQEHYAGPFQTGTLYGIIFSSNTAAAGDRYYRGPGVAASTSPVSHDLNGDLIYGDSWNGTILPGGSTMFVSWVASAGFIDALGNPILPNLGDRTLAQLIYAPDGVADNPLPGGTPGNDDVVLDARIITNNGGLWEDYGLFGAQEYRGPYLTGHVYGVIYEDANPLETNAYYVGPLATTSAGLFYEFNTDFILGNAWNGIIGGVMIDVLWGASTGFVDDLGDPILPNPGDQTLAQLVFCPDGVADALLPGGVPAHDDVVLDTGTVQNTGGTLSAYGPFGPLASTGPYQPGSVYGVIFEDGAPEAGDRYYAGPMQATVANAGPTPDVYEMNRNTLDGDAWNRSVPSGLPAQVHWQAAAGFIDDGGQPILPNLGDHTIVHLVFTPDNTADPILPAGIPGGNDVVLDRRVVTNNGGLWEEYGLFGNQTYDGIYQSGFLYGVIFQDDDPNTGDRYYAGPLEATAAFVSHEMNVDFVNGDMWNGTVLAQDVALDFDGDGMANDFEMRHFGDYTSGIPGLDPDVDGLSNIGEYIAGTDPGDSNSCFDVESVARDEGDIVVTVQDTSLVRIYRLECADDFAGTGTWTPIGSTQSGTGASVPLTDTGGAADPSRVYRSTVSLPSP